MRKVKLPGGLAQVNWHGGPGREGLVGVTYLDGPRRGLSAVLDEHDVWPEGPPDPDSPRDDLSQLSDEALRERLQWIRGVRRPENHPPKATKATGTKALGLSPTKSGSGARSKSGSKPARTTPSSSADPFAGLTPEQIALAQKILSQLSQLQK